MEGFKYSTHLTHLGLSTPWIEFVLALDKFKCFMIRVEDELYSNQAMPPML